MVEWSITAVLKTVEARVSGGSNPSLRATQQGIPEWVSLVVLSQEREEDSSGFYLSF